MVGRFVSSSRIFTACLPQQVDLQLLMTDTVTMAHYDLSQQLARRIKCHYTPSAIKLIYRFK